MPEITVGRGADNLISIPVDGVSRCHARFFRDGNRQWFVEDLGSTNGITVNGLPVEGAVAVQAGDEVRFCRQSIKILGLDDEVSSDGFSGVRRLNSAGVASAVTEVLSDVDAVFNAEPEPEEKNPVRASATPRPVLHILLIFMSAVLLLSVLMLFWGGGKESSASAPSAASPSASSSAPGLAALYFEKTAVTGDNVFRFAVRVENGKADFVLDDIGSHRHFARFGQPVPEAQSEQLRSRILQSGIWTLENTGGYAGDTSENGVKTVTSVMVAEPDRVRSFRINGKFLPEQLAAVESAVNALAESFGLQTVSLTPEELFRQAEDAYVAGNRLLDSIEVKPEYLRDAIRRFQCAVDCLEQFEPHPPLWDKAKRQLGVASGLRRRKLEKLEYERVRLGGLRDLAGLRNVFIETMALADEDSQEYSVARSRLLKLDSYLRDGK